MKADGTEADGTPNEKGEAEVAEAEAAAPKPVGGKEPKGVDAVAPNAGADDFCAISPNAGVEDDVGLKTENGADVVLGALAPKDPKVGAATVEDAACWAVPKLNCILGGSEGVVAGVATFEDPKEKTPPAGVVDVGTAVVGTLNPNPLLLEGLEASLGNWYGGGADDPKLNDAVEVWGVPNEKAIDSAAAVDVLVVGAAPAPEPNVKMELELAGRADPTVDLVTDDVVGKPKLLGAAVAAGIPNVVGAAVAVCKPKVGREVVAAGKPKAIGAAVVVGNPKVVGAGAEVVIPKDGIVDVTVVGTPKVGVDAAAVETEPPNTVGPPKLKDGAVDGLNSDNEGVDVAPPVKLNEVDVVVGIDEELLEICDSFSVVSPKFKVGFSVEISVLANGNEGFVCTVPPKEKVGAELTGACLKSDGAAGFFPRISITLPVSSDDTLESGTTDPVPKLKMGLSLEADVVVVDATLNPVAA